MSSTELAHVPAVAPDPALQSNLEDIKQIIVSLFSRCNIPYTTEPYDQELHDHCLIQARKIGFPLDDVSLSDGSAASIRKALRVGVVIASTAYAHFKGTPEGRERQVFIVFYSALLTSVEDVYPQYVDECGNFFRRFVKSDGLGGSEQVSPLLKSLELHLKTTYTLFPGAAGDMILAGAINFMASLELEVRSAEINLRPEVHGFSELMRLLSGLGEPYSLFIFPNDISIIDYVRVLPELTTFINTLNDVLSFYKEELASETANMVSLEARFRGLSKVSVVRALAEDTATCHGRILQGLSGNVRAKECYESFARGFFYFHTSLNVRYHLDHVFPDEY